jgi:hypothetical protein
VAAVAAGGVAFADASNGGAQMSSAATQVAHARHGLLRGARLGRLTHADLHLYLKGHDVDVRIDRGVLKSVTGSSIVLHELDGSDVTVPVDPSTRVIKMRRMAKLSDLRVGDVGFAVRRGGGAAQVVRSPGHPPLMRVNG